MAREEKSLLEVMGEIELMRPWAVLQRGDRLLPVLYLMNVARADIRRERKRSIEALREKRFWWETDAEDRAVIWMSTSEGDKVWMAEHGSPLVPPEEVAK